MLHGQTRQVSSVRYPEVSNLPKIWMQEHDLYYLDLHANVYACICMCLVINWRNSVRVQRNNLGEVYLIESNFNIFKQKLQNCNGITIFSWFYYFKSLACQRSVGVSDTLTVVYNWTVTEKLFSICMEWCDPILHAKS